MVNCIDEPAQIGDKGLFVKDGIGVASIFIVCISSDTVWQPPAKFLAFNLISQHPDILTSLPGITKWSPTIHSGWYKLSIVL